MPPRNDHELLRAYVEQRDQGAFAELVTRHADMVYSAATRQVGRSGLADDVTQAVFILLARKASTIGSAVVVAAWLHKATRYVALNAMKIERRRRTRERGAAGQLLVTESRATPAGANVDGNWAQGAALLDEGIAWLGGKDREAVVLRFLERRSFAEVGQAIGASEDAAQMRVSRAVDKLRSFFRRKGLIVSAATLRAAVNANCVIVAPAALKSSLAPAALHGSIGAATPIVASPKALAFAESGGRSMMLAALRTASAYAASGIAAAVAVALLTWHFPSADAAPPREAPSDTVNRQPPPRRDEPRAAAHRSANVFSTQGDAEFAIRFEFLRPEPVAKR